MMKKHFISFLLSLSMAAGLIAPSAVMKSASVYAAGGNMTLIAVQDTYVQGGSLINNNMGQETTLTGRDWSDKPETPSAYMLPYVQFELPPASAFRSLEDINGITLKMFCTGGKDDEYFVGISNMTSFDETKLTYQAALDAELAYPANPLGANHSKRLSFDHEGTRIEGSQVRITSVNNEWLEFNITDKVKEMIAENTTNDTKSVVFAVAPRSRVQTDGNWNYGYHQQVSFRSKEAMGGLFAPRIEIKANSYLAREKASAEDYYIDPNAGNGAVKDEELKVGGGYYAVADFGAEFDLISENNIQDGTVRLFTAEGSAEPLGLSVEVLENPNDSSGTRLEDISFDAETGMVEIGVSAALNECAQNHKNLILKITADNGESTPVRFYSSRGESGKTPALHYTMLYEGEIRKIAVTGEDSVRISLDKDTTSVYGFSAFDQYGENTDGGAISVTYSLDSAPQGVTISEEGLLTVSKDALPGTAVVRVSAQEMPEMTDAVSVEIVIDDPTSAEISGVRKVKMPGAGKTSRKQYQAVLYQQDNLALPYIFDLTWSVEDAPKGIRIESGEDGAAALILDNTNGTLQLGQSFDLAVCAAQFPDVSARITVTLSEAEEVYSEIILPVMQDTFLKKGDIGKAGNLNSDKELLAKQRRNKSPEGQEDTFDDEGTNRETYLQFNGLDNLPENITSVELVLTSQSTYSNEKSPADKMPPTQVYPIMTNEWSEEAGTIQARLPVGEKLAEAKYAVNKDEQTVLDITSWAKAQIAAQASVISLRVSQGAIADNNYIQKFYPKEAPVKKEYKPHLRIVSSYVRVPSSIEIEGAEQIGTMLAATPYTYQVYLCDQYGQRFSDGDMMEYTTSISVAGEYDGVSVSGNTVTVQPNAKTGALILHANVAEYPDLRGSKTITVYKSETAKIQINGLDRVQLSAEGGAVTAEYELAVYDQNDFPVEIGSAVYELAAATAGVSIDSVSGQLKVEDYAVPNREVVVVAYSKAYPSIRAEKPVRILPVPDTSGIQQHPSLLYSNADLIELRKKIEVEPFASYYNQLKQKADQWSTEEIRYLAQTDPREENDPYHHVYPLVETDENGNERVLDRKRPWQYMMTDLFYTQGNFTFTPPKNARYAKLQAIAKGQGITNFDDFSLKYETGGAIELYNSSFETGNLRYVDENLPYQDDSDYQVVETSADGQWEYLADISKPMPDGFYYVRRAGSDVEFEWDNQQLHKDKVAGQGTRAAKIRNNTVASEAGISTDKIRVNPGQSYVLTTAFGASDKLVGEKGRLPEYSPLDKTAGLYMQVVYYDGDGNEVGTYTWMDNPQNNKPMNINWQVKAFRRTFDDTLDACATIYAVTKNLEYAERAKEILKYQLEDMRWGMQYRTTSGYNSKMNDTYEAVHIGRHVQRDALTYDMIYDSGVISEEEDAYIRNLFNWVAYKLTDSSYYNYTNASGQIHNYNADRISALILFALAFQDNQGTEQNKYKDTFDYFYDHVLNSSYVWSLPTLMKNGVYDAGEYGGMWCENIRYHRSVMAGWLLAAKALDRYNPDFNWLQRDELKQMARMWCTAQGPRMVVSTDAKNLAGYPTIGDSSWRESVDMAAWCASLYRYSDPELSKELMYTWDRMGAQLGGSYPINILMDNDPTLPRKNPQLGSMYLDNVGYTYFRQNFDVLGKENMVIIPNSPGYGNKNQPIHDHHDRGSFAYFANGTPMSLDSGMGAYFGSDSAFWRSSKSHNQILFWSDSRGWLSNAGGDGNSYTSDSAKTRNYDSETKDFFTSPEVDCVTIQVNPAKRAGKDTDLQWNRHFAYVKNGINALIFWDECKNTRKSQFNLFMASTAYRQNGNVITADMQNDMQMDVYLLNAQNPDITGSWVPSAGKYGIPTVNGSEQQQLIQYEQAGGEDYLTVLYAKSAGASGLSQQKLNTGSKDVTAFRMTHNASNTAFYIAYNDSETEQKFSFQNAAAIRNPQTGERVAARGEVNIPAGKMLVFIDAESEAPKAQRIVMNGEQVIGLPLGDTAFEYSYEARVFDQYNQTIDDANVRFEIVNGASNCFVTDDGVLTVQPGFPEGGKIRLAAYSGAARAEMEVTPTALGGTPASVEIVGSNTLVIPDSGSMTYKYQAVFKNSANAPVSGAKAIWTLLDPTEGVTMNSFTGQLTVSAQTEPKTVIHINAAQYTDPSVTKTLEIVLVKAKESGIYADIPAEIAVSEERDTVRRLTGYATDQAGNPYRDVGVTFALKQPVAGVSLSSDGKLEIKKGAVVPGESFIITVTSQGDSSNRKEYRVSAAKNTPTDITISGPAFVKMSGKAKTVSYSAQISDKNGQLMSAKILWSVSGLNGVSVRDGNVTIPGSASGTFTLCAQVEDYPDIADYLNVRVTNAESSSGGSGGGGGGGGGSRPSTGAGGDAVNPSPTPSTAPKYKFTDVPEGHWASEYIYSLVDRGAINGKTETVFEPNGAITRAEFVKILVSAMDIRTERNMPMTFRDVQVGDWYYDYVAIAVSAGIVTGISEDYYGASELITREQMAAMLCRALDSQAVSLPDGDGTQFRDQHTISAYASEPVLRLKAAGILNGNEQNYFLPINHATRAEAAKVIDSVVRKKG